MPSDNEIGGEALGASVGVAIGGLLGGGAGAAAGGLIGAFLGGAASGSGKGRPSPGWNPNEGFPRDNTLRDHNSAIISISYGISSLFINVGSCFLWETSFIQEIQ